MPTNRLDNPELSALLDPLGILKLTDAFPDQCAQAIRLGADFDIQPLQGTYERVALLGVGGSAAAGDYLQAIFDHEGKVPFAVVRSYDAPAWIDSKTLVLASSYSGNTEETLSADDQARERGAKVFAITTGGELRTRCETNGHPVLTIPEGQPPRTALGYSLLTALQVFARLELVKAQDLEKLSGFLTACSLAWRPNSPASGNRAKQIAEHMFDTVPVFYGLGDWQGAVAKRWKAQVNENAKALAFANAFPELNHNEILGWIGVEKGEEWSCFVLEGGDEGAKLDRRAGFTLDALPKSTFWSRVKASGTTLLEKMLSLTLLGDYASVYLAYLRGVDPGDISLLDRLKEELKAV